VMRQQRDALAAATDTARIKLKVSLLCIKHATKHVQNQALLALAATARCTYSGSAFLHKVDHLSTHVAPARSC
jgi:hypothetical protein